MKLSEQEIIVGVKYATDASGVAVWLQFVIAELPPSDHFSIPTQQEIVIEESEEPDFNGIR